MLPALNVNLAPPCASCRSAPFMRTPLVEFDDGYGNARVGREMRKQAERRVCRDWLDEGQAQLAASIGHTDTDRGQSFKVVVPLRLFHPLDEGGDRIERINGRSGGADHQV